MGPLDWGKGVCVFSYEWFESCERELNHGHHAYLELECGAWCGGLRGADSRQRSGVASATAVEVSGTSYTPTTALANKQTHYWRVRAQDGEGQYGAWSSVKSLSVNWGEISGLSPTDGVATTDTTPSLSWNAVPGAAGYEVQIAASEAGLANAQAVEVSGTSYTPSTALANKQTHYWRVRAKDGDGQYGTWSAVASILIARYAVGDTGPAEGIVFYDKGSYSDGWRYLEAAKSDQATRVEWGGSGEHLWEEHPLA